MKQLLPISLSCDCYKRSTDDHSSICTKSYDDPLPYYYDSFYISWDTASSSLLSLTSYVHRNSYSITWVDATFTALLDVLTGSSGYAGTISYTSITLSIDQLEDMPEDSDLQDALTTVFSWVSGPLPHTIRIDIYTQS